MDFLFFIKWRHFPRSSIFCLCFINNVVVFPSENKCLVLFSVCIDLIQFEGVGH